MHMTLCRRGFLLSTAGLVSQDVLATQIARRLACHHPGMNPGFPVSRGIQPCCFVGPVQREGLGGLPTNSRYLSGSSNSKYIPMFGVPTSVALRSEACRPHSSINWKLHILTSSELL